MPTVESSSCSAVPSDQWKAKLKKIKLEDLDLEAQCTFASGAYSRVSVVRVVRFPEQQFALKTIEKASVTDPDERDMVLNERKILRKMENDFIVKCYKTFKDKKCLYMLTEFLPGGNLLGVTPLSEGAAKFYVACVVEALDYLHTHQDMVHNDIKSANLVLDADGYAKLIDFGFAMRLEKGQKSYDNSWATAAYAPPEVAWQCREKDDGRDRGSDLWSLGVLVYELLQGWTPFDPDSTDDSDLVLAKVIEGIDSIQFSKEVFSEAAEDIVRCLCRNETESRLGYKTINEIREHRWFDGFDWGKLRDRTLTPPVVPVPEVKSAVDIQDKGDVSNSVSVAKEEASNHET